MKVALYARVSTKKQDLDSMIKALVDWAIKNNHEYVLYSDLAISGRKNDREGIQSLLADARLKKIEAVGVVELSRVGRSLGFIHKTIEELSGLGISVFLVNSGTELKYSTLEGRALIGGLALAADIEWMLIQDRNARGRQAIKDRGIKVGRHHKEISQTAINALHEKGMSLREIAAELGVSPPTIMRRLKTVP